MVLPAPASSVPVPDEVFTGNTKDETSLARMLDSLDCRTSGAAGWPSRPTVIMDRGLATDENLELLRKRGEHYIVTTPQSERRELFAEIEILAGLRKETCRERMLAVAWVLPCHQGDRFRPAIDRHCDVGADHQATGW